VISILLALVLLIMAMTKFLMIHMLYSVILMMQYSVFVVAGNYVVMPLDCGQIKSS